MLTRILGSDGVLTEAAAVEPYLTDQRRLYHGRALIVALPRSVEQVSHLLAYCNENRIGVVPQGGNTSYCGGATPDQSGQQIVLSLKRLNRIRGLDPLNYSMTVEAGCILADVQRAADDAERLFPLSLGSEGTCQIGGNLSTNAGGTSVLRYGMMRDLVLGLEVVLSDGRILSTLGGLRKDNTGYDIKSLFLGAEGTLGVITASTLKLFPKPRMTATAFVAVQSVEAAVALLASLREASGDRVSSFELIPRIGIELTARHIPGVKDPLGQPYEWHVLCELSSSRRDEKLDELLTQSLAGAFEARLVLDAVVAQSDREREALWKIRETIPEAQRLEGASLKHDISLPTPKLPEFVAQAGNWVRDNVPEGRLVAYGHVGDGNLHFNLNQAPGTSREAFLAREPSVRRAIHDRSGTLGAASAPNTGSGFSR